jgi:hypothetical protein
MHAWRMWRRGRHPVHSLPFEAAVPNELAAEWAALPAPARRSRLRHALQRDLALMLAGQSGCCVDRAATMPHKLLWIFNWTTIGDALMDLAARASIPDGVEVDLCIAAPLAPLFAASGAFGRVFSDLDECAGDYDFVLVHELNTHTIRAKGRLWPRAGFAPVLNCSMGERFARTSYCDARVRHVLGLAAAEPPTPRLDLGEPSPRTAAFEVAVALGARDPRRRYPHWHALLPALAAKWPLHAPPLRFTLLGNDNAASDAASIAPAFVAARCRNLVGQTGLLDAAYVLRDADAFLGTDGGLMHVAAALGRPGVGLFAGIDPAYRLANASPMRGLAAGAMAEHERAAVEAAFTAACAPAVAERVGTNLTAGVSPLP